MAVGLSDGTAYNDSTEWLATVDSRSDKQRSDQREINQNSMSGDFESRFGATYASTMPLQASTELAGALKRSGGSQVPGNSEKVNFDTKLTPEEEPKFQEWKAKNAPNDSGEDYDLRGAFKGGAQPAENGHWPDTWKKPNHPTFSDQSMYAKDAPDKAGTWDGDRYIPPAVRSTLAEDIFGRGEYDVRPALVKGIGHMLNAIPEFMTSEPGSIDQIEKSTNLAAMLIGGPGVVPAKVATKMADGTLGSFAGVKSQRLSGLPKGERDPELINRLYKAQNLELDAAHPDAIHEATGFHRGTDSRWRYEIDDSKATLKDSAFDTTITPNKPSSGDPVGWTGPKGWGDVGGREAVTTVSLKDRFKNLPDKASLSEMYEYLKNGPGKRLTLPEVFDHPELYKAYPELVGVRVETLPTDLIKNNVKGMMSHRNNTFYLAPDLDPAYAKSVILHEVQHKIQDIEGFASGGSSSEFLPKELPQAEKEFLKIREEAMSKSAKELGTDTKGIESIKRAVAGYIEGRLPLEKAGPVLELAEKYPEVYKRLTNISKSEKLIDEAKTEAHTKYERIKGEVEARNVQSRMTYDKFQRAYVPPYRTEDVPKFTQIDPKDIPGR